MQPLVTPFLDLWGGHKIVPPGTAAKIHLVYGKDLASLELKVAAQTSSVPLPLAPFLSAYAITTGWYS